VSRGCWLAFVVCTVWPVPTRAQSAGPSDAVVLVGGLSYGVGDTRFRPEGFMVESAGLAGPRAVPAHERGLAKAAFFGVQFRRRVAIVFDSDNSGAGDSRFSSRFMTIGARYRPASRIWLQGSAGLGALRDHPDSESRALRLRQGLALGAAAGIEILHISFFSVDVHARVSTAAYGELRVTRVAMLLGYNVSLPLP
jgi:hypothetical protein